jgi:hypothetical protein
MQSFDKLSGLLLLFSEQAEDSIYVCRNGGKDLEQLDASYSNERSGPYCRRAQKTCMVDNISYGCHGFFGDGAEG